MNTATATKMTSLLTNTATETLVQSALILDNKADRTQAERLTLAWINDELVARVGGILDDEEFDGHLDNGLTFFEAMLVEFPGLAA